MRCLAIIATLGLHSAAFPVPDFCPECKEQADAFCASECFHDLASVCDGPMRATVEYRNGCSSSAYCLSPFAMLPSNDSYEASTCQCYAKGLEAVYASCGCQMPPPEPCPAPPPPETPKLNLDIFVSGDKDQHGQDYASFKEPAIITTKSGRLLAFAEGRITKDNDHLLGSTLVVRSSDDGGASWSSLRVAHGEEHHLMTGATPVADFDSGDVHLLFTRDNQEIHSITSQDDGEHWSPPTDHSATLVPDHIATQVIVAATGPGAGTQLPGGRLVAAASTCTATERTSWDSSSHCLAEAWENLAVYSEDHGATWRRGNPVGRGDALELNGLAQVAQLPDDKLAMVLSARPEKGSGTMAVAVSSDHGETWAIPPRMALSSGGYDPPSQTPVASGSTLGVGDGLLVGDGSILYMLDSVGGTEPVGWRRYAFGNYSNRGFSSIAYNSNGPVVLYETGSLGPHEKIAFAANFGFAREMHMAMV